MLYDSSLYGLQQQPKILDWTNSVYVKYFDNCYYNYNNEKAVM